MGRALELEVRESSLDSQVCCWLAGTVATSSAPLEPYFYHL